MQKRLLAILIPVALAIATAAITFIPVVRTAEQRVFDTLLRLRPPIPERDDILLLDIGDEAISQVGLFPWTRDYMARGLITLAEFDVNYVIFDIEYVDPSPALVDQTFLRRDLPETFDAGFGTIVGMMRDLFGAVTAGQIPLSEASSFLDDWTDLAGGVSAALLDTVSSVVRDNDAFLGRAAALHGRSYFTVNILDYRDPARLDRTSAADRIAIQVKADAPAAARAAADVHEGEDIRPTIAPILARAAGAGFPNVVVDGDGVRRRIDLLARVDDAWYAQLVFKPLLHWLGSPEVELERRAVVLRGARLPGSDAPTDLRIPLSTDGRILINWPQATYDRSFRHLSYYRLVYDWETEDEMIELLRSIEPNLQWYVDDPSGLSPLYDYAAMLLEEMLETGDRSAIDEWREYRALFFENLGALVRSTALDDFLADITGAIESGQYDDSVVPELRAIAADVERNLTVLAERYEGFAAGREELRRELPGSFAIIGWVGTSTTDIGVTPFDPQYMNVGTHASLLNTILQQQFLTDLPGWVSLLAAALVAALVSVVLDWTVAALKTRETKPVAIPIAMLAVGIGALLLIAFAAAALFRWTGVFVHILTPLVMIGVAFLSRTVMQFIQANREKEEVRGLFGEYVADDVVAEVLRNPELRNLGGRKKHLTAMFTDIQGFSTFSEKLKDDPERLVLLLNKYLTAMSDVIIAEHGTIDKFEGDAIIAFWGAPVEIEDAPIRACRAAIAMKKVEKELNPRLIAEGLIDKDLVTRIGLNTGEMVVGNMGTERRKDYTIMGHNVNLAARLEGVNKQYKTAVLMSELTYRETEVPVDAADPKTKVRAFSARKLDQVRVVGINEPVRLYELIDLREIVDQDEELIRKLRQFNTALTVFERQEWREAKQLFDAYMQAYPEDETGKVYTERAAKFLATPPQNWDGVWKLDQK